MVFIDDPHALYEYQNGDTTVPLSSVVSSFEVYRPVTGNGTSGMIEAASNQVLSEEFGDFKSIEDEIIPQILSKGELQKVRKESFA